MNILLIDDDLPSILSLKDVLEEGGNTVIISTSSIEGIAAFRKYAIDIVITDFKMPGMNGIEVLKTVKKHDPKIYVILLTGFANIDNAIDAVNNRAYAFFRKPLDVRAFMQCIFMIEEELYARKNEAVAHSQLIEELTNLRNLLSRINNSVE